MTKNKITCALLDLPYVTDVIVEFHDDRKIVPIGSVRITVKGGYAGDIVQVLRDVVPAYMSTVGLCDIGYRDAVNGQVFAYQVDHIDPIVAVYESLWKRFMVWLKGIARLLRE
jgi:hypothetical protein